MTRIARLHLTGRNLDFYLYLPVTTENKFDPEEFTSVWPVAYGDWAKNNLFAEVDYNEEKEEIQLRWCDGDRSLIPLRSGVKLGKGVILRMTLVGTATVYEIAVSHYDIL